MARVLIAGAGIAGMAAALGFARAGWEVEIHEQATGLGEVGAGLQMSPNACRVLNWLDVLPDVRAAAFVPEAAEMRDGHSGEVIYRALLGDAAETRWGAPYLHVHRADLLDVLSKAALKTGAVLRLGQAVERYVERPRGGALHLAGGTIVEGDLVLGADGIRSALRRAIMPDEAPRFTGQIAWRGLIPAAALPEGMVRPNATVWAGPGAHLVTYFLRGGDLVNFVAVREQAEWKAEGWAEAGDGNALRAAFAGWHGDVAGLLEHVGDCFLWGLFDRPEQVRWADGRLMLVGDAAHPMLPFMAQGAAMALEDVAVLARHVDPTDIGTSLQRTESERWPRVTRVLQQSAANGRMFHRRPGPLRSLTRLPVQLVSRAMPGLAAGQLDWLYGYDPT